MQLMADLGQQAEGKIVHKTNSARLVDLGDGVLAYNDQSRSHERAGPRPLCGLPRVSTNSMKACGKPWSGTQGDHNGRFRPSVGPNGQAFCAGANLGLIAMLAAGGTWDEVDEMINGMQQLLKRAQPVRPVVTAPFRLTLGGVVSSPCKPA